MKHQKIFLDQFEQFLNVYKRSALERVKHAEKDLKEAELAAHEAKEKLKSANEKLKDYNIALEEIKKLKDGK